MHAIDRKTTKLFTRYRGLYPKFMLTDCIYQKKSRKRFDSY